MPYVNVRVAGKISDEEKKKVISGISEVLEKELGKPKSSSYVVIDEVAPENWGVGDETIAEMRAAKAS